MVREYDEEYKVQAVKLAHEIGTKRASEELGIPKGTLGGWVSKAGKGELDTGENNEETKSLAAEVQMLRRQVKEQQKEIRRLEELNEFLEEASAFFAASRQKYAKKKD